MTTKTVQIPHDVTAVCDGYYYEYDKNGHLLHGRLREDTA